MFSGSAVALVTPMQQDTAIDFSALLGLVEWHIASGTQALVINGTTAETPTLTWVEQKEIIRAVVTKVAGKIPVIVGTGGNATLSVIERNHQVADLGANGLLIVAPYYNKPMQSGLIAHFERIATETSLPIIMYNHPGRTGVDLQPETVIHLAKQKNIVGIKEVSGDLQRIQMYQKACPPDFKCYCGDDIDNFAFLEAGGQGVISVTANILPVMMRQFCDAALSGDKAKAKRLQEKMQPLNEVLVMETNPIPVKWALYQLGKIPEGNTFALIAFSKGLREPLEKALKVVELENEEKSDNRDLFCFIWCDYLHEQRFNYFRDRGQDYLSSEIIHPLDVSPPLTYRHSEVFPLPDVVPQKGDLDNISIQPPGLVKRYSLIVDEKEVHFMVSHLVEKYKGKAKTIYTTEDPTKYYCEFRNDTSAFNGQKIEQLERKGLVNNYFNAYIMQYLENHQIPTHFVERVSDNASIVEKLEMFPLECVVRNYAAGSICKRLGLEKGQAFKTPIFEFFYKDDALGDPLINESHIETFGWATAADVKVLNEMTLKVNEVLSKLFLDHEMILVDYKLEFGRANGKILLGDEFTPDGCRIWDANTLEVLDKDRFRQNMGNVVESYEIVARRLNIALPA